MSKETTHSVMGSVVYAPGVLIATAMPPRKGKTSRDQRSGAHARRLTNRASCRFRSSSSDCSDCPNHHKDAKPKRR